MAVEDKYKLVDRTFVQFESYVRSMDLLKEEQSILKILRDIVPIYRKMEKIGSISAVDATDELIRSHNELQKYLAAEVGGYSKHRWIWYLRRVPKDILEGKLPNTRWNRLIAAETIVAMYSHDDSEAKVDEKTTSTTFPINQSVVRRVVRFCYAATQLSDIHVSLRWAGKGADFRFFKHGLMPVIVASEELRQSVEAYDHRVLQELTVFGGLGTFSDFKIDGEQFNIAIVSMPDHKIYVPVAPLAPTTEYMYLESNFNVDFVSINYVFEFLKKKNLQGLNILSPLAGAIISILHYVYIIFDPEEKTLYSMYTSGYVSIQMDAFLAGTKGFVLKLKQFVAELGMSIDLPEAPESVLKLLSECNYSCWPLLHGPLICNTPIGILVNVFTMQQRLNFELEFPPVTGSIANTRAQHFEDTIQSIIDSSPWKPGPNLASLTGRTITIGGKAITDLDAVAELDGVLLLISCKSIPNTRRYDTGSYNLVRNVATIITKAVSDWNGVIMTLNEKKKGDNFDFSQYAKIVGVVCTPHVMYAPFKDISIKVYKDLPQYVSASELSRFLFDIGSTKS